MKQLLIVGTGKMSTYYYKTLNRIAPLHISAYNPNPNSLSASNFSSLTGIKVSDHICKNFDYAIVCSPWQTVNSYLSGLPAIKTLYEKPIAYTGSQITQLLKKHQIPLNSYVAFNRRFYETVATLKEYLQSRDVLHARLTLCDSHQKFQKQHSSNSIVQFMHYQISHYLDMVSFVFGKIHSITKVKDNLYLAETTKSYVFIETLFNAPRINSLEVFFADHTVACLSPFECLKIFNSLSFTYSNEFKMTKWDSNPTLSLECDYSFKPGIKKMLESFLGDDDHNLCSLESALDTHVIIEKLSLI